jgi:hypothetical protein
MEYKVPIKKSVTVSPEALQRALLESFNKDFTRVSWLMGNKVYVTRSLVSIRIDHHSEYLEIKPTLFVFLLYAVSLAVFIGWLASSKYVTFGLLALAIVYYNVVAGKLHKELLAYLKQTYGENEAANVTQSITKETAVNTRKVEKAELEVGWKALEPFKMFPNEYGEDTTFGFRNKYTHATIIDASYEQVKPFAEGIAAVKVNGVWGYIDETGKTLVEPQFDDADLFKEGMASIKLNGKWGAIDVHGVLHVGIEYDGLGSFYQGIAIAVNNEKRGFVDSFGTVTIPIIFDRVLGFQEDLCAATIGEKSGFIDKNGNKVIPFIYDRAGNFGEGLAHVKLNGKYGFIDQRGSVAIPFKFEDARWGFSDGLAAVKLNGKWGYIDKTGEVVIPFLYTMALSFIEGLAKVEREGKVITLDTTGAVI